MRVIEDHEVRTLLHPARAVAVMRRALIDAAAGRLVAPARSAVELGEASLTFTTGAMRGGPCGFRVYGGWGPESDQLTAVWGSGGRLEAVVTGPSLGALRTGALGGAAVDALARSGPVRLGVIGSGTMAWAQVWGCTAVRELQTVDVFSPRVARRESLAARIRDELGVDARAVEDPRQAVSGHEVVIASTIAREPVFQVDWLDPGTHVSSTGPKLEHASELDPDLARRAAVMVSDSPAQAQAEPSWFSPRLPGHLGAVISGNEPGRTAPDDLTLYCSTGLAGTEVLLARSLLDASAA